MAQIDLTEFFPGDAFSATEINASMSNWVTQSTNIDEYNVREEGITRRIIETGAVAPSDMRDATSLGGPLTLAVSATPTMIMNGGNVVRLGPLVYDESNGDMLMIRLSFEHTVPDDTSGAGTQPEFGVYLYYGEFASDAAADGSAPGDWTFVTASDRKHQFDDYYKTTAATNLEERGYCTMQVPLSVGGGFSSSTLYIAAFYSLSDPGSGNSATVDDLAFSAMGWAR